MATYKWNIFWDAWFSFWTDLSEVCLDEKLSTYQLAVDRFDVGINHRPIEEGEAPLLAYVGEELYLNQHPLVSQIVWN